VAELADVIRASGALAEVEARITHLTGHALDVLDVTEMPSEARAALRELAIAATARAW
jgi:geranylgeranyl pyrophosphate synthase